MIDHARFRSAIDSIDATNRQDPNLDPTPEGAVPKEWLYSQRMSQRLDIFAPQSSEALQLAARSQHIQRWLSPRSDYPMGREGYNHWRKDLNQFHADTAAGLLLQVGYEEELIDRVKTLLMKKGLKRDAEVQTLEDVVCMVFLEHYLTPFAAKHSDEKLISIIQKTWRKMSDNGHDAALKLPLNPDLVPLIKTALKG